MDYKIILYFQQFNLNYLLIEHFIDNFISCLISYFGFAIDLFIKFNFDLQIIIINKMVFIIISAAIIDVNMVFALG